jgi:hypothetical protein
MTPTLEKIERRVREIVESSTDDETLLVLKMYLYIASMYSQFGLFFDAKNAATLTEGIRKTIEDHTKNGQFDPESYIEEMSKTVLYLFRRIMMRSTGELN